jgi:hypothetical protein
MKSLEGLWEYWKGHLLRLILLLDQTDGETESNSILPSHHEMKKKGLWLMECSLEVLKADSLGS